MYKKFMYFDLLNDIQTKSVDCETKRTLLYVFVFGVDLSKRKQTD